MSALPVGEQAKLNHEAMGLVVDVLTATRERGRTFAVMRVSDPVYVGVLAELALTLEWKVESVWSQHPATYVLLRSVPR